MKTFVRWFITLILVIVLGFAGYTYLALHYVYSSGNRSGYVQKFSRKGWVFKTWEGELAMVNIPGAMQEKFWFTVRDENVAKKINGVIGQHVVITYEEHKGIPSKVFGDTPYFVVDVHPADVH